MPIILSADRDGYDEGAATSTPHAIAGIILKMTVQTFRELLSQRPFKPFRLVMSSGDRYEVRHSEMAMLTRTSLLVGVEETEEGVPAEFKICSLLHVAAIEPASPQPSDANSPG